MEWRDVVGFEGKYKVSDYGEIKTVKREFIRSDGKLWKIREIIRKKNIINRGYFSVSLKVNNIGYNRYVHRLVAIAFIPNPFNLPTVNHIDGNKLNNHVSNLEWCSYSNNNIHAFKTGLRKDNVFVYQYDENDNFMREYYSLSEANRITGICRKGIKRNLDKNKTYNNYLWKTF